MPPTHFCEINWGDLCIILVTNQQMNSSDGIWFFSDLKDRQFFCAIFVLWFTPDLLYYWARLTQSRWNKEQQYCYESQLTIYPNGTMNVCTVVHFKHTKVVAESIISSMYTCMFTRNCHVTSGYVQCFPKKRAPLGSYWYPESHFSLSPCHWPSVISLTSTAASYHRKTNSAVWHQPKVLHPAVYFTKRACFGTRSHPHYGL